MPGSNQSPREYMVATHPELFSDSAIHEQQIIERSQLDYHLESLTSRSQEKDFERFARRLAEREICPNLLPQTGPTGGGDSKVDAETYPVSDTLSLAWFTGIDPRAASERWGFAFSAKKDWRTKVRQDIAKIAGTGRGYTRAFFITSRYVPDRDRAQMEDELRTAHEIDVRILDRTWIIERVLEHEHEDLAIEELGVRAIQHKDRTLGPRDTRRKRALSTTEKRIKRALGEGRLDPALVEQARKAAILARGLERPRHDVVGRFARARRLAEKHGTSRQRLMALYHQAWTTFWWYEDYAEFLELYPLVEEAVSGSGNPHDWELLSNLWVILQAMVSHRQIDASDARLAERSNVLSEALSRMADDLARPGAALHAQSLLLKLRLFTSPADRIGGILQEVRELVLRSDGYPTYPFKPFKALVVEFGDAFGEIPEYEPLFEAIVQVASKREGEIAAAKLLLRRGSQQLQANRPYEAIRSLGRSLTRLAKYESRREWVHALELCATAYERAGLYWAARGTALNAAAAATHEFAAFSNITPQQISCYERLKWIELRLGRVPQILAWHHLENAARALNAAPGELDEEADDGSFDGILGMLFLKADFQQLGRLTALPDTLDRLGLFRSSVALKYALGYPDVLQEELGEGTDPDGFASQWRDQPASAELPPKPNLGDGPTVELNSLILGCQISVSAENASPSVELAESLLAAMEAFFSTGIDERVIAYEPALTIHLRRSSQVEAPFTFELGDLGGHPHIEIRISDFDPHTVGAETQQALQDQLMALIVSIAGSLFLMDDPEEYLNALFRTERAPERALSFTTSFVSTANVLGHDPKTRLVAWAAPRTHPLTRMVPWDINTRATETSSPEARPPITPAAPDEPVPEGLFDLGQVRHSQLKTMTLMRPVLWGRAHWVATAFFAGPDVRESIGMGPVFENIEAGLEIFTQWRREIGARDTDERLRVTILRGIDRDHPHHYRVAIADSPESIFSLPEVRHALLASQSCTMYPESSANLDRFLTGYDVRKEYLLLPVALGPDRRSMHPAMSLSLLKRNLHVRWAWEIGRNDPDSGAIFPDDQPLIPDDLADPPVLKLLEWKRAQAAERLSRRGPARE